MQALKSLLRQIPLLSVLALLALGLWKHQAIADWAKLRGYNAPADIRQLAAADTMTASAQHLFYINRPQLLTTSSEFAQKCPQIEQTIVLGCYQSNEDGIYLRNVTDSRLNGVEEVTAAHEMLHGAYDRLGSKDKNYVDGLLLNYYQNGLSDQRIKDTINAYKSSEPNDLVNEMHSIFGTEVASLPASLEKYYQRYFNNRSAITALAAGYQVEFTSRIDQIKSYEAQLASLKQQIDSEENQLSMQQAQLQADRASLDSLRNSGQIAQYNARVASFNSEVDSYNSGVSQLKNDINRYNNLVDLHNELADELRGLYTSLGTDLSTQSSQ